MKAFDLEREMRRRVHEHALASGAVAEFVAAARYDWRLTTLSRGPLSPVSLFVPP